MRVLALLLLAAAATAKDYARKADVIYGRKHGLALTMDVFTPKEPSGSAVIFVVSSGWFSSRGAMRPYWYEELLQRGHTVFAVVHGSQPKYSIDEIVPDVRRAVRFVRHHAKAYGIERQRIGIMGASAGGHLSLMTATAGDPGKAESRDPVERESSRVQAVAAFFPPTDFLNWGRPGFSIADHPGPSNLRAAFDFKRFDPKTRLFVSVTDADEVEKRLAAISPLTHVSEDDPPALLVHGDRDGLVPLQQSEVFVAKLERAGVEAKLLVREGKGHGWMLKPDVARVAAWFEERLAKAGAK